MNFFAVVHLRRRVLVCRWLLQDSDIGAPLFELLARVSILEMFWFDFLWNVARLHSNLLFAVGTNLLPIIQLLFRAFHALPKKLIHDYFAAIVAFKIVIALSFNVFKFVIMLRSFPFRFLFELIGVSCPKLNNATFMPGLFVQYFIRFAFDRLIWANNSKLP